jgi:hypothetical protein
MKKAILLVALLTLTGCTSSILNFAPWTLITIASIPFILSACSGSSKSSNKDKDSKPSLTIYLDQDYTYDNLECNFSDYISDLEGLKTNNEFNYFHFDDFTDCANHVTATNTATLDSRKFVLFSDVPSNGLTMSESSTDIDNPVDDQWFFSSKDDVVVFEGDFSEATTDLNSVNINMGKGDDIYVPGSFPASGDKVDLGEGEDIIVLQRVENPSTFYLNLDEDKIYLADGMKFSDLKLSDDSGKGAVKIEAPSKKGSSTYITLGYFRKSATVEYAKADFSSANFKAGAVIED